MSVPDYRANTSPVTSGYPCCNNLLVQVTPLNQTKLVFRPRHAGVSLSGWSRPHWHENEVGGGDSGEKAQPLTFPRCKSALGLLLGLTQSVADHGKYSDSLGRPSIRRVGQQPPREEAAFMEDMEDGWRAAPSKHHRKP